MSNCQYAGVCGGCPWITIPWNEQLQKKKMSLQTLTQGSNTEPSFELNNQIFSAKPFGTRHRMDLVLEKTGKGFLLGLSALNSSAIVDLHSCPQVDSEIEKLLNQIRQTLTPAPKGFEEFRKGSLRLRKAPDDTMGIWLDFSNVSIRDLLKDQVWLRQLMDLAIVEIGQKGKRLTIVQDNLKLSDPVLFPWSESFSGSKSIPLFGLIKGFSQPGPEVNQVLVNQVLSACFSAINKTKERGHDEVMKDQALGKLSDFHILEWGSGNGNFTLPLLDQGAYVTAVDIDGLQLEGLLAGAEQLRPAAKNSLPGIHHKESLQTLHPKQSLQTLHPKKFKTSQFSDFDILLVDPPRSGMMELIDLLEECASHDLPRAIVYVSCFPESWSGDRFRLEALGYGLSHACGVDQFPQTPHLELVSVFRLPTT